VKVHPSDWTEGFEDEYDLVIVDYADDDGELYWCPELNRHSYWFYDRKEDWVAYTSTAGPSDSTATLASNRWSCIRTQDGSYRFYRSGMWVFTAHDAEAARRFMRNGVMLGL